MPEVSQTQVSQTTEVVIPGPDFQSPSASRSWWEANVLLKAMWLPKMEV